MFDDAGPSKSQMQRRREDKERDGERGTERQEIVKKRATEWKRQKRGGREKEKKEKAREGERKREFSVEDTFRKKILCLYFCSVGYF